MPSNRNASSTAASQQVVPSRLTIKYQGRELVRLGAFWFYFGGNGFKRCFINKREARTFIENLNRVYSSYSD